jgi:hypothetical protein
MSGLRLARALGAGFALTLAAAPGSAQSVDRTSLEVEKGYFLSGSGNWRTPNPAYKPGSDEPREFGLEYRWGPHRQSILGEIVGVGPKGRAVYASLFYVFNPVTHRVMVSMASWDGTVGPAEERRVDDRTRVIDALLYKPDGTVTPSLHVFELLSPDEYRLIQQEWKRGEGWVEVRNETWRQIPAGAAQPPRQQSTIPPAPFR